MELEHNKPSTLEKVIEVVVSLLAALVFGAVAGAAVWGVLSFAFWVFNLASVYPFMRCGMVITLVIWVFYLCDTKKGLTSTW